MLELLHLKSNHFSENLQQGEREIDGRSAAFYSDSLSGAMLVMQLLANSLQPDSESVNRRTNASLPPQLPRDLLKTHTVV